MTKHRFRSARFVCLALLIAPVSTAQKPLRVEAAGVEIKPPPEWVLLGSSADRGRARAVLAAPEPSGQRASGAVHTATIRVLLFPPGEADGAAAAAGAWPKATPYASFADYTARAHGPGLQQQSSKEMTAGGKQGRLIDAKSGDVTLQTLLVTTDAGEVAIELEALTSDLETRAREFAKALESLRLSAPKANAAADAAAPGFADRGAWLAKPAGERTKARAAFGTAWLAARKTAEPGFKTKVEGTFLVISRANDKDTKRFAKAAAAAHAWASSRFGGVSDDAVMPAAIRIFANPFEHDAYRAREPLQRPYDPDRREILCFVDPQQAKTPGEDEGMVVRGVVLHLLHDKDPRIVDYMPRWVEFGLNEYARSSRVAKDHLEFFSGEVESGRMKYWTEEGRAVPSLWHVIQESIVTTPADGQDEPAWEYTPECARTVRWLESGGGETLGAKDFLPAYLAAIAKCAADTPSDPAADVDALNLTESQRRDVNRQHYAWRDAFLKKVNDLACPLDVPAWEKANAAWLAFNAKLD
jgi:hypothetical protein